MRHCCIVCMAKIYWSRGGRGVRCSFDKCEHPIVCQLGGGDPDRVGEAAKMVAEKGYDAINLNCGCPSNKVFVVSVLGFHM